MIKSIFKMNLPVLLALVFVMTACSHTMNSSQEDPASTHAPAEGDPYAQGIVELNQVVKQNPPSSKTKKAHLELARLYSNHNNQRRNYYKAMKHLEAYVNQEDSAADNETLDWLAALKEINRLSKEIRQVKKQLKKSNRSRAALTKTNRKLTREEIKLREKNRQLEESNQKLHKTIEMLKNLDQRLEEKRRTFNN
jgi:chromosome segregation ATPase